MLHSGCRRVEVRDLNRQRTSAWLLSWVDRAGVALRWRGGRLEQHPGLVIAIPPGLDIQRTAGEPFVHLYLTLLVGHLLAADAPLVHRVGPR